MPTKIMMAYITVKQDYEDSEVIPMVWDTENQNTDTSLQG